MVWAEFNGSRFAEWRPQRNRAVLLDVPRKRDSKVPEVDQQQTVRRVLPDGDDQESLERLDDDLQELIDAFPGHTFRGRFQCIGDNHWSDMWGVAVIDGRAVRVKPTVVWPDDAP
ncbi:DUF6205 family protein [Streptomyces sp. NBC_01304]|uniref:DUF6205 family protein n=1 Tax=Streptomyces sp. NBC_01304 TaxID=2903818 RepID=UPI002E0FC7F4